jgi:hypothetical protein
MVFVERGAEFVREMRYVAGHMRRSCGHALWRVEHLLSKLEGGESLDNSGTAAQLSEAREELRRALGSIERMEKLYEADPRG